MRLDKFLYGGAYPHGGKKCRKKRTDCRKRPGAEGRGF